MTTKASSLVLLPLMTTIALACKLHFTKQCSYIISHKETKVINLNF